MNKTLKRNLIDGGIVGVAALYGLLITYFKTELYWDYALDGMIVIIQSFLYGLAVFALASLLFRNFGRLIKSNTWAKLISFLLSVVLVYGYQVLMILILALGSYGLDLTGYLEFQFLPDFQTYAYILTMDAPGIPAKLAWILAYLTVWLKYYFAALFFFVFVKAKKIETTIDALNSIPSFDQTTSQNATDALPAFCPYCGTPVNSTGKFCSSCGKPLLPNASIPQSSSYYPSLQPDVPSTGFNVLGFFIPMVGLILYAVWSSQYPKKAKAIGKWALIGFISSIVVGILSYSLFISFYMSMFMNQK